MAYAAVVAGLALLEYIVIVMLTGRARGTYKVEAPATTGHPVFERWFRVQQNTLEQLVVFFPALFLCATYFSGKAAAGLGLVFVIGRGLYAQGYVADPAKRGPGFAISALANLLLTLAGLFGALAFAARGA